MPGIEAMVIIFLHIFLAFSFTVSLDKITQTDQKKIFQFKIILPSPTIFATISEPNAFILTPDEIKQRVHRGLATAGIK